ncbi:MAG: bifunctional aspartate kinase/homoserine dehydrogenase I [Bacteroidetes bacterium]|nr:MAG: bifunctional aspartate kinase/homoserine dehydrogenase I [Bacteroidota bacterium]
MKVLKFGGSSVQNAERIRNVVNIVKSDKEARVVICSAFGGITDQLIKISNMAASSDENYKRELEKIEKIHLDAVRSLVDVKKQSSVLAQVKNTLNELEEVFLGIFYVKELSLRTLDYVSGFGERLSCYIVAEACKDAQLDAQYLDARKVVRTNDRFGEAEVDFEITNPQIRQYLAQNPALQIATGFIGSTINGISTTLGRGGSDYTASIFAAALEVDVAEIWTDVDGVMTADPRKVKKAFSLDSLTYIEAMEMSHFGAKVIYPPTMLPAMRSNIPISIRNTFNPSFKGTIISNKINPNGKAIKGISSISNIALLRVQGGGMVGIVGISSRLFGAIARENINIILITQASSEHSICFAVKPEDAEKAKSTIEKEFNREIKEGDLDKVIVEYNLSIIAVVGENMRKTAGLAGKLFSAMGKNGISISAIAQGSSELNISFVIKKENESKALNALHQTFFVSDVKTLNVFITGVGLIGNTLINQIIKQKDYLLKEYNLIFKIIALASSKKRLFCPDGINENTWKEDLNNSEYNMDMDSFVQDMTALNMLNSIFIDNTASKIVAEAYEKILASSISIVTPNKIAASSNYEQYLRLKTNAKNHNVIYLYETNVGAALPVISTLRDLVSSGDKIIKIEAVLSGTLSYIFNNFDETKKFSQVVKKAKELGFTEPDPREDLRGADVARKILILAREAGFPMEFNDVAIEGFLPKNCDEAHSVDDFFAELEKTDQVFEQMRSEAAKEGKILRFIAKLENGKAIISLQAVDQKHPFYSLSGSDNIIAFTTTRYPERPLVVKGSGAGAEVTAAGVFADMIRVANYL